MKKRLFTGLLSGLLVWVLLFSIASTGAMAAYKEPTPFSQMKYVRPDAEAMVQHMNGICRDMDDLADMSALEAALDAVAESMSNYNTMYTLAMIYSGKDMREQKWLDELDHLASWSPQIDEARSSLYRALPDSKFAPEIEAQMGSDFIEELRNLHVPGKAEIEIQKRILALSDQYTAKLATATVDYHGKSYTLNEILMMEDSDAYTEALMKWLKDNSAQFSKLYITQIKLRQMLASALGYKNVTEMEFEALDYTPAMVEELLNAFVGEMVPVIARVDFKGSSGHQPDVPISQFTQFQRTVYPSISLGLSEALNAMYQYGLYDFDTGAYKTTAQYTTFLQDYDMPFIMMSYQQDFTSMTTLNHEFGHFYNYYVTEGLSSTMDISEVHSHALELLASNHFSGYFGKDAGSAMQYDVLYRILSVMQQTASMSKMELMLYDMDPGSLTPQKLQQVAQACSREFGFSSEYSPYFWVIDSQLVSTPFYMVGYASSAAVSMQIWERSITDSAAASKAYERFVHMEQDDTFLSLVSDAGLENPFKAAAVKKLAALFDRVMLTAAERKVIDAYENLAGMMEKVA